MTIVSLVSAASENNLGNILNQAEVRSVILDYKVG